MSQSIDDPKTYDSKNLASFYLTTSHYCPIKVHGLDTHTGGVREENVSVILQQGTGKIVNTGRWSVLSRTTYGKYFALDNPNRPLINMRGYNHATSQSTHNPNDDDEEFRYDNIEQKKQGLVVSQRFMNDLTKDKSATLTPAPIDLTNVPEPRNYGPGSDDELDYRHQSFDETGEHAAEEDLLPGGLLDDDQEEQEAQDRVEGDDNSSGDDESLQGESTSASNLPRSPFPRRERKQATRFVAGQGGTLDYKKNRLETLLNMPLFHEPDIKSIDDLKGDHVSLAHLTSLDSYFTGHVWFDKNTVNAISADNSQSVQTAFLDELTNGREVSEAKSPGVNYHHLDGDPDSDIALDYQTAVEALWGADEAAPVTVNSPAPSDQGSSSSNLAIPADPSPVDFEQLLPTVSQYLSVQRSGRQMCKAVGKDHLFGSGHNLDDPILDCFMTYGLEPTSTEVSGYKRVEIILQVDETLVPDSMKDKSPDSTLKHGDIVYHREKIGDLNKEDANMRTAYFKAVTEEMSALCALKFAEITIIPETRDPISTRFVLKVKRKADGSFDRVKARLVVRGFMQRIGLDFYTSYSPMATLASCRLVLCCSSQAQGQVPSN